MAKKSKRQPRRCGICGRKLPSEQYVRSKFTGNYFCRLLSLRKTSPIHS